MTISDSLKDRRIAIPRRGSYQNEQAQRHGDTEDYRKARLLGIPGELRSVSVIPCFRVSCSERIEKREQRAAHLIGRAAVALHHRRRPPRHAAAGHRSRSAALPSCISGRRSRSPHSAGVRISFCCAASCSMPSPVPTSCSSRSENSASVLRLSAADALAPVVSDGHVTRRAAEGREDLLAGPDLVGDGASRQRRQELHERFEVVDRALAGARVDQVFGVLDQVAFAQPRLRDPAERLERETCRW